MLAQFFFIALFALSVTALSITQTFSFTLRSSLTCVTHLASSSAKSPIPTSTRTTTILPDIVLIVETSVPVHTVTATPVILTSSVLTSTVLTTTLAATTDTFSSTSTVTATSTTDVTSTAVSTVTTSISTSTTSTSLIPAPSGFQPADETTGESSLEGVSSKVKRHDFDITPHGGALLRRGKPQLPGPLGGKYPSSVLCVDTVQPHWVEKIIVVVGHTTTSTVPGSPVTKTVTSTQTSTSTVAPEVSTTITGTTTITSTSTNTATISSVTTSTSSIVSTSTVTSYAACATNNILGPQIANGSYTNYGSSLVNSGYEYGYGFSSNSAYDCCVSCISEQFNDFCQVTMFSGPAAGPGVCQVIGQAPGENNPALCNNPGLAVFGVGYTDTPSEFSPIIFSNGPCGTVVSS